MFMCQRNQLLNHVKFGQEPVTTPTPPNKVSSVIEPPRDTDVPLIVIDEFDNLNFAPLNHQIICNRT